MKPSNLKKKNLSLSCNNLENLINGESGMST